MPCSARSSTRRRLPRTHSYGSYIDGALATALADDASGIYRGIATAASSPQDVPFPHARLSAQIDRAKPYTLTKKIFDRSAWAIGARNAKFPWMKRHSKHEWTAPIRFGFLGVVLPENDAHQHLLNVLFNLANYSVELETRIELNRAS